MDHLELIKHLLPKEDLTIKSLTGGDINQVYLIESPGQQFVAKINEAEQFPEMLMKEANGLQALKGQSNLAVPTVIEAGQYLNLQYLLMEYIPSERPNPVFWEKFGSGLAKQHQLERHFYGFEDDNFIGSLVQSNRRHENWSDFLINERFLPQIKMAVDSDKLLHSEANRIEVFFNYVEELWPGEPAALLHGDLWSGNFIAGRNNQPYLIDPAVYYGHREMDLGMMHLFGGFDPSLFAIYNSIYPLEKGWEKRIPYNQLYPLLVHLNLFGRIYFDQISSIIQPFS